MNPMHATTIVSVRNKNSVALGGDGQVTLGNTVMKSHAQKIRRLYNDTVLAGFAGSVADALTLFERIEKRLEEYHGDIVKACVELTRDWRMDKYLRKLEAMLLIADKKKTLLLSGSGEVIEPDDPVIAIGSGGDYARSAALALIENTKLSPLEIVKRSMQIAGNICIYTNTNITSFELK